MVGLVDATMSGLTLKKGVTMIMFDIAEWVANILVLGLGLFFWTLAFGMTLLILTEIKERYIDE